MPIRLFSALLAALLIFLVVCSSCVLAAEAGHDCTGDDCEVCAFLEECRVNIRRAGSGIAPAAALFAAAVFVPMLCAGIAAVSRSSLTLIAQKVRLDM
ncbi:MAG: hypothetical protein K6F13_04200 [Lachnospiraceae bacterium]|nr:hypothetical protein [Lachnospiraceae bacterium]